MRKSASVILIVVVLALAIAPTVSAISPTTMVVQAPRGLILRSNAGLGEPIVLVLQNGEQVRLLGSSTWKNGIQWTKVEVKRWGYTYQGFCSAAYLASYAGYPEPVDSWVGGEGWKVISPDGVRLRSGPGLAHYAIRIVPYGTILKPTAAPTVAADGYTWRQLMFSGTTGWAAGMYLQHVGAP